jgi:hypothetical protein
MPKKKKKNQAPTIKKNKELSRTELQRISGGLAIKRQPPRQP